MALKGLKSGQEGSIVEDGVGSAGVAATPWGKIFIFNTLLTFGGADRHQQCYLYVNVYCMIFK